MSDSSTVGHGTAWGPSQNPQCTGAGREVMEGQNGEFHTLTLRRCISSVFICAACKVLLVSVWLTWLLAMHAL